MINKRKTFLIYAIAFFILLCVVLFFSGCSDNSGYKKVTLIKAGIRFSFEYPSSYSVFKNDFQNGDPLIIPRYLPDSQKKEADREIRIETFIIDANYPNANALLNGFFDKLQGLWAQFELLERSSVQVSGIDGEMIVFSGLSKTAFINLGQLKCWEVYLDYKGQILTLAFYSKINVADGAEAEFEHFIESFKFLD